MTKEELTQKKQVLQGQLQQKVSQFQNTENMRNQLTNEIIKMQGQIEILDEVILKTEDDKPKEEKKETPK